MARKRVSGRDPLTREEIVAMWLWGAEYAAQRGGAIEWWEGLSPSRKRSVREFLAQLDEAQKREPSR